MGQMLHHAIVVTSYDHHPERAHRVAVETCGEQYVTALGPEVMNGYRSFMVMPDGSKEGWDLSDDGDATRARFVEWLNRQRYSDGSTPYDWVVIEYGERYPRDGAVVVNHFGKVRVSDNYKGPCDLSPSKAGAS